MARITRRKLLKLSATGAVAARTGGLAAILASGRAPAFAQGTTVHWLRWSDFVPASDVLLKGQITHELHTNLPRLLALNPPSNLCAPTRDLLICSVASV